MQDVVWICTYCNNQQIVGCFEEMKLFKKYVDDIICTVRGDRDEYVICKFFTQQPAIYIRKS